MKTYITFVVQGYDRYDKETDLFMNTVKIEVIAKDEKQAVDKAKTIIKKPLYRLLSAYERVI